MFSFDIDYKKKRVILSLLGLIASCVFTFAQVDQLLCLQTQSRDGLSR